MSDENNQQLSGAEARNQLDAKAADSEFQRAWLAGDPKATEDFTKLTTAAAGAGDRLERVLAGDVSRPLIEAVAAGEIPVRLIADAVETFRGLGLRDEVIVEAFRGGQITSEIHNAAKALKAERMADPEWRQRWVSGDVAAVREMLLANVVLGAKVVAA